MIAVNLINGDCIQEMPKLGSQSVNLILTDLPYGVTQNPNDKCLPLEALWREWQRILKPAGTIVLTSQFPFTIDLINSNRSWFRYDLIWNKVLPTGFLNANRQPLRVHEHVLVFYNKLGKYYPQRVVGPKCHGRSSKDLARFTYGEHEATDHKNGLKYPNSIITIQKPLNSKQLHPTEKPVELAEFLIKSYTAEDDTVLDCCMGAGWSAVAAKRLNRNFVGIEINRDYFEITKQRVSAIPQRLEVFIS